MHSNALIISRSSHDARLHLNFTRNSIPDNGHTTRSVRAGIVRDDRDYNMPIIDSIITQKVGNLATEASFDN